MPWPRPAEEDARTTERRIGVELDQDPLYLHRRERFVALKFDEVSAGLLAATRSTTRPGYLDWHDVKRQLDRGLTHELAVAIFT